MRNLHPLALTMGDPAGIGGEISLKCWLRRGDMARPFIAIDNVDRLRAIALNLHLDVPIQPVGSAIEGADVFNDALPVLNIELAAAPMPGVLNPENAAATISSIRTAVAHTQSGDLAAVVTNPIHKNNLYSAGFGYPGHTEFLADLAGTNTEPVMMLACDGLRTVPITTHLSLSEAIASLSVDRIVSQSRITAAALEKDFGISAPRLAIAGLNPHAGEDGAMGDEERSIIEPAIRMLQRDGLRVSGPHPPDTLFSAASRATYDAAICMYHDQALIPIKTLDFSGGVNVTLGLPFIRTSPDHGTATDIAGKGIADETSMVAALRMAAELSRVRGTPRQ